MARDFDDDENLDQPDDQTNGTSSSSGNPSPSNQQDIGQNNEAEYEAFLAWRTQQSASGDAANEETSSPLPEESAQETPTNLDRDNDSWISRGMSAFQKNRLWIALPVVIVVALVAVIGIMLSSRTNFSATAKKCESTMPLWDALEITGATAKIDAAEKEVLDEPVAFLFVSNDGSSMAVSSRNYPNQDTSTVFDGRSEKARDASIAHMDKVNAARDLLQSVVITCANKDLGLPESVMTRMGETRGMDGTQEIEKNGIIVSWSYHPSSGLSVLYEKK